MIHYDTIPVTAHDTTGGVRMLCAFHGEQARGCGAVAVQEPVEGICWACCEQAAIDAEEPDTEPAICPWCSGQGCGGCDGTGEVARAIDPFDGPGVGERDDDYSEPDDEP